MSFLEMHMVSNGIKFDAVQFHIRCLPHIVNLAAKDFIKNTVSLVVHLNFSLCYLLFWPMQIGNDAGLIDSCGIDDNDDESSCVPTDKGSFIDCDDYDEFYCSISVQIQSIVRGIISQITSKT